MKKNTTVLCASHDLVRWRSFADHLDKFSLGSLDFQFCDANTVKAFSAKKPHIELVILDFSDEELASWHSVFEIREYLPKTAFMIISSQEAPQALIRQFDMTGLGLMLGVDVPDQDLVQSLKTLLERQKLFAKTTNQAFFDMLTGLPNADLFRDRFDTAVHRVGRLGLGFGLALCDIDQLQLVNQSHGFSCGDQILVEVGQRFKERMRKSDTAARLGGDRFALIFENVIKEKTILRLAEKIYEVMTQPFVVEDRQTGKSLEITLHFSTGMCLFPQHLTEPCEVMEAAEVALAEAKKMEGSSMSLFNPPMGSGEVDLLFA